MKKLYNLAIALQVIGIALTAFTFLVGLGALLLTGNMMPYVWLSFATLVTQVITWYYALVSGGGE